MVPGGTLLICQLFLRAKLARLGWNRYFEFIVLYFDASDKINTYFQFLKEKSQPKELF